MLRAAVTRVLFLGSCINATSGVGVTRCYLMGPLLIFMYSRQGKYHASIPLRRMDELVDIVLLL